METIRYIYGIVKTDERNKFNFWLRNNITILTSNSIFFDVFVCFQVYQPKKKNRFFNRLNPNKTHSYHSEVNLCHTLLRHTNKLTYA